MKLRLTRTRFVVAVILLLAAAAIAIAIAMDTIVTSRVSSVASFHELQGIQGADTTKNVAVQAQARKAGKSKEAKELDDIRGAKVRHYQVISAADYTQSQYYEATEKGLDTASLRAELESAIPNARAALAEMKTLTDREIELVTEIGADLPAIEIAKTFYKSMETIVDSLQLEALSDEQIQARINDVQLQGKNAVANARRMAANLSPEDLDEAGKNTLEQEVVIPGEENAKGMGSMLSQIPSIIFSSVAGISEGLSMWSEMMDRYGNNFEAMAKDLLFKQGMFSRSNMNAFQQRLDAYGAGTRRFLAEYSPFVKAVGAGIGRPSDVDPLGYGANVVVRFTDPQMNSYIVDEDEELHWRVIVDKLATKWDDQGEVVRPLLIFDYDDTAVETAVKMISGVAPGYDEYVRQSRLVYIFMSYDLAYMKSYVLQMSFQNAAGQEMFRYEAQDPYNSGRDVRRRTIGYRVLETVSVISPPEKKDLVRKRFGSD